MNETDQKGFETFLRTHLSEVLRQQPGITREGEKRRLIRDLIQVMTKARSLMAQAADISKTLADLDQDGFKSTFPPDYTAFGDEIGRQNHAHFVTLCGFVDSLAGSLTSARYYMEEAYNLQEKRDDE